MEINRIYMLITYGCIGDEQFHDKELLFRDWRNASKIMKEEFETFRKDYPEWECYCSDTVAECYEEGRYGSNNINWIIKEVKIQD